MPYDRWREQIKNRINKGNIEKWMQNFIKKLARKENIPISQIPEANVAKVPTPSFYPWGVIEIPKLGVEIAKALDGVWFEVIKRYLAHEFKHYLQYRNFNPEKVTKKPEEVLESTELYVNERQKKWGVYSEEHSKELEEEAIKYSNKHSEINSQSKDDKMVKARTMILLEYIQRTRGPFSSRQKLEEALKKNLAQVEDHIKTFLENHPEIAEMYENPLEHLPSMEERFPK